MFEAIERMIEAREQNRPITPQMAADARAELDSYRAQSRLLKRLNMNAERAQKPTLSPIRVLRDDQDPRNRK